MAITCLNSFEREDDQDEPSKEQEGDENQKSGRSNGQSSTFSSEAKTSLVDTDDEHLKMHNNTTRCWHVRKLAIRCHVNGVNFGSTQRINLNRSQDQLASKILSL